MIVGKLAVTDDDKKIICNGMPLYGSINVKISFGFFDNEKCIGGMYLSNEYPHLLTLEFYCKCPTIVKALSYGFSKFFEIQTCINGEINITNTKSLKVTKMLGFVRLYVLNNKVTVQLRKENWRYKNRHPIK